MYIDLNQQKSHQFLVICVKFNVRIY